MPIDGSRRKIIVLPLVGVLALAIVWSGYWFLAFSLGKRMVAAKRAELRQDGWSLLCRDEAWGGYPFRFEFRCESPVMVLPTGIESAAGRVRAVTMAYNPWHVLILFDGPTTLATQSAGQIAIDHGRAVISLTFDDAKAPALSAEVLNPVIRHTLLADRIMAHARPASHGTDIALSVDGLVQRSRDGPAMRVDRGELKGTLLSRTQLSVRLLDLSQDKVRVWGKGILSLDPQRRIAGKLAMETNDLNGFLGIVEPYLNLTDQQKANMRMVFGLLGGATKADLVAREGQLFFGPFKIADISPIY